MLICDVKTKKKKAPKIELSVYNKLIRMARNGNSVDELFNEFETLLTYKKLSVFTFIMITKDHQLDKTLTAMLNYVKGVNYKQRNLMILRALCYHYSK